MKRSDLRERVFLLLFRTPFHTKEEMVSQEDLFLAPPETEEDPDFPYVPDEGELPQLKEKDARQVLARYREVAAKIPEIDQVLSVKTSGWDISRIGKVELAILRLAVFEMLYDDAVPNAVAINEAVELAKRYAQDGAASFVNGVLAKIA